MPIVPTRRLELMRGPDVGAYLARSDAAILPLGPTEAHGLHLPLGCDHLIATATAVLAADLADALVLPPFAYSWPGATARLPGTVRLAPDFVQSALIAVLDGALAAGFRRLALVCAHGPDEHLATLVGRHFFERTGRPVAVHHAVPGRGTSARERELAEADAIAERADPGQGETSRLRAALEVLGLPADLVDTAAGPAQGSPQPAALRDAMRRGGAGFYYGELPQHIPTPRRSDPAVGRAYLEATAAAIADSLAAMRELP
jgi:creatinine amidohydrolase/Fe(II)-dependent formamide hydrolase-like protein